MDLRVRRINLTFAHMLQISLRNSFDVLDLLYEAFAHLTDQLVLFFQALVENIFLLLWFGFQDKGFNVTTLLFSSDFIYATK